MSHIPTSAMPHARAHDEADDLQAGGAQPAPEPTTATPDQPGLAQDGDATLPGDLAVSATDRALDVAAAGPSSEDAGEDEAPLSSAAPATATGNREGSAADRTAQAAGAPAAAAPEVESPVPTHGSSDEGAAATGGGSAKSAAHLSPARIAAIGIGAAAAIIGIVAAVLPMLREKDEPKSRKRRKK